MPQRPPPPNPPPPRDHPEDFLDRHVGKLAAAFTLALGAFLTAGFYGWLGN